MEKSDFFSLIKQMDFALLLTSSKQEEECFNRIIETAVSITDSEAGHLLLLDNSSEYLELKAYKSLNNEKVENFKVPIGKGITGNVFISGQALNIADVSKNKEMYKSVSSALHDTENTINIQIDDIAIVPIKIKDNVIGVLEVINKKDDTHFSQLDMHHLYSFAKIASIVIEDNYTDRNIREIFVSAIKNLEDDKKEEIKQDLSSYTNNPLLKENLKIAEILNKIGDIDEKELNFCKLFLSNYLSHLEKKLLRK
ncbi:GAF domain-containing protein [Brachyspira pulli]|uniref:GAF domain-containing protein n=1 Tax=Brachyspira pulli TaxID=310721 RepID=UPI003007D509